MHMEKLMNIIRNIGLALVLLATVEPATAIERLGYETLGKLDDIEIRHYDSHLLASVRVRGDFKSASYNAFRPLFNFISGDNSAAQEIAMTAPVLQTPDTTKDSWVVSFVMPRSFDLTNIPAPSSDIVAVVANPATTMAVVEYRGGWGRELYAEHEAQLLTALDESAFRPCGEPLWARHNSPMTPWFLRKNEVLVPVCGRDTAAR